MVSTPSKPLPNPISKEASLPFWEGSREHKLMLPRCDACGRPFWYPRELCPYCLSREIGWFEASGRGVLYSFTVIHQPAHPAFRGDTPYVYALVELDEGSRIIANLVECEPSEARIDLPVEAVYDDVTEQVTLVKFRPRAG